MSVGPGSRLSHYEILDEISRGGMGVVYRARDLSLNRDVALKILPPELVSHVERRKRFIQEAQAASVLEHPHIAVIYEVGEAEGTSFIAMELIRGEKLSDTLFASPLGAPRTLDLAVEIAEALALAHDRGVIHRDLKPANVMLTEQGHAKVIDFGLAKLVGPIAGEPAETTVGDTDAGAVLGTVSYMSPEQARGSRVDHRTDIFTFGILLHEMLCGQPPFRGPSGVETLNSILTAPPPPLPPLGAGVAADAAEDIRRIRDKCLAKAPDDRYQGMRDLVVDLRAARRRLESTAHVAVAAPVSLRRFWWAAAAAIVALLAAALGSTWWRPAPQSGAPPAGKPSVAVLYFENTTGSESLDWLRTGLAEMLVTDLSQSPQLEIVGTDRVQQILMELNRADARTVSFDVVQELARRAGVTTVLLGSYVKSGEAIRINVRLQNAADGKILGAERVDANGEDSLFPTMDDLTRRIKARLEPLARGGAPSNLFSRPTTVSTEAGGIDRDLREVTTSSIEAYRYYAEGINLHERFREAESVPLFEKALAVDPTFALAMAKLAVVHSNLGHPAESSDYARRAYEYASRVTVRERAYIAGYHLSRRIQTLAEAIEAYENGLKLYPDHASVRNNVALLYTQLERRDEAIAHVEELRRRGMSFPASYGMLAALHSSRGDFDKAVGVLQEYLQLHPDVAQAHGFLGSVLIGRGKLDEALAAFSRTEALEPGSVLAANGRFHVTVLRGEWADARAVADQLSASQDPFRRWLGQMQLAMVALYRGDSASALASIERAGRAYTSTGGNAAWARARAAQCLLAKNNPSAALAEATKAREESRDTPAQWSAVQTLSLAQFAAGRSRDATHTLDELRSLAAQLPSERELRRVHHLRGELALAKADLHEAVRELTEAERRLPRGFVVPSAANVGSMADPAPARIWFALASAHLAAGQFDEAERWFSRIHDGTVERVSAPIEYVRSFYWRATLNERQGDREKARAAYARFLEHWRDGDLDRDKVAEAERKLRALATN